MKKILCIVISVLMIVSLSACGGGKDAYTPSDTQTENSTIPSNPPDNASSDNSDGVASETGKGSQEALVKLIEDYINNKDSIFQNNKPVPMTTLAMSGVMWPYMEMLKLTDVEYDKTVSMDGEDIVINKETVLETDSTPYFKGDKFTYSGRYYAEKDLLVYQSTAEIAKEPAFRYILELQRHAGNKFTCQFIISDADKKLFLAVFWTSDGDDADVFVASGDLNIDFAYKSILDNANYTVEDLSEGYTALATLRVRDGAAEETVAAQ